MAVRFVTAAAQQEVQTVQMKYCFRVFLSPTQCRPAAKARLSKERIVADRYQATVLTIDG